LFERPQGELVRVLNQLGCDAELRMQRLTIRGQGWKIPPEGVLIDRSISSQFASALVLSAWGLSEPLTLRFAGDEVSQSYFALTIDLAKKAGMQFLEESRERVTIAPGCRVQPVRLEAESDLSSAFSVAALAAVRGEAEFLNWPQRSLQPDAVFPEILERMGCRVTAAMGVLTVARPEGALRPIEWNMRDCPDLFPVLGVLCAFSIGKSKLFGAPHLAHKESSRIEKVAEIIRLAGRKCKLIDGGLEIDGAAQALSLLKANAFYSYQPDHDHRLAMAAAVACAAGVPIDIKNPEVVNKSFPGYWAIARSALVSVGNPVAESVGDPDSHRAPK
jgi:3-phosphoshikimate 1-carboxyvinyltransferase